MIRGQFVESRFKRPGKKNENLYYTHRTYG